MTGGVKFHGFLGAYSATAEGGAAAFDVEKAGATEATAKLAGK